MKWIYGKRDWDTIDRGQENCYLMTNGLGGFSSLTMLGSVARNDHSLLMACTYAPNCRYNMVHRVAEQITVGGHQFHISSQEFADGKREEGFRYLYSFSYEDTPVWKFLVKGIEIRKEVAMKMGENMVGLHYEIRNETQQECTFTVIPFYQFVKKSDDWEEGQRFSREGDKISSGGLFLYLKTNGQVWDMEERIDHYYYSYDQCDGRRAEGAARADHCITVTVRAKEKKGLDLVFGMEKPMETAEDIIADLKRYRACLLKGYESAPEMVRTLIGSADQFLSSRVSTGGQTILAGFPFFEDWGRDTMIALPGICLFTGRYEVAKNILRTFAENEKDGLMPNLFPEGQKEPMYNTVDAALLFINCVYLYYEKTGEEEFVREMYPVMERILDAYSRGTHFGIHMDSDGLLMAGEGLDQVTWMDVRAGEILPTPRHGKPVEINAYWFNALCIMSRFARLLKVDHERYDCTAERVKAAFCDQFWIEEKGCLKDVVSGKEADGQIRCNQIWAVSMPFTMLPPKKERQVVERVFEKLYTPYGLRTLEEDDEQFHPYYRGEMLQRDLAYHQGTIWVFPLGAYYLACLKVNGYSQEAKWKIKEQLEGLESMLREGCIGQLPEIYDGGNPTFSRGCFAQAWSVGELLRVYEEIGL